MQKADQSAACPLWVISGQVTRELVKSALSPRADLGVFENHLISEQVVAGASRELFQQLSSRLSGTFSKHVWQRRLARQGAHLF